MLVGSVERQGVSQIKRSERLLAGHEPRISCFRTLKLQDASLFLKHKMWILPLKSAHGRCEELSRSDATFNPLILLFVESQYIFVPVLVCHGQLARNLYLGGNNSVDFVHNRLFIFCIFHLELQYAINVLAILYLR